MTSSGWSQLDDSGDAGCTASCTSSPAARAGVVLALDQASGQVLLFGGIGTGVDADTWVFAPPPPTSAGWAQVKNAPALNDHEAAMEAYDAATGQLVLFGGAQPGGALNQTYVWTGSAWTQVDDSGDPGCVTTCTSSPPGALSGAIAFDPATQQLVLVGGDTGAGFSDATWLWNGSTWSQSDDTGDPGCTTCTSSPPVGQGAMLAFDQATSQLVLFGGVGLSSTFFDDTWLWTGSTWTQVDDSGDPGCTSSCTSSPPASEAGGLVYDPATAQLVLYGGLGSGSTYLDDTWLWNGSSWSQTDDSGDAGCTTSCTSSPQGRWRAVADFDPVTGQLVLFGGSGSSYLNDTWMWNGSTWNEASFDGTCSSTCVEGPQPRIGPTMAFDPGTGQMILEGGEDGPWLTDTWDFDLAPLALAPATLSWSSTLTGYDAWVNAGVVVEVASETSQGWDLTVSANTGTLPPPKLNASSLSAASSVGPTATCLLTTCVAPTGNSAAYPVTAPASPADLYNASAGTGVGDFDLSLDVWASVPANTRSGTYGSTITLTLDFGP